MRNRIRVLRKLLVIGTLVGLIQGCSMIGTIAGAEIDRKKPVYEAVEFSDTVSMEQKSRMITATVKPGKEIIVITRDRAIWGKYNGVTGNEDDLGLEISQLSDSTIALPVKNVSEIRIRNKRNGAVTGFIVGAVIDAAVLVIVMKASQKEPLFGDVWEGVSF